MIEQLSDDNPCLIYNYNTKELSFVLTNRFLTQTLAERKAENNARFAAAELNAYTNFSTFSVTSYSASDAIAYARFYVGDNGTESADDDYHIYSASFPIYGKNCTNYVSQCVNAGGISMVGSAVTAGTYSSTTQWFCHDIDTTAGTQAFAVSTSWINADDFYTYMAPRVNQKYTVYTLAEVYEKCRPGDVVQIVNRNDNDIYHSVIISAKDASTVYYCGHTNARQDADIRRFDETEDYFIILSFLPVTTSASGSLDECGQCGDIPNDYYTQFYSASLSRVIECPTHESHDAEVYQYRYDAYCSVHDNYVGSIYETEYICLEE